MPSRVLRWARSHHLSWAAPARGHAAAALTSLHGRLLSAAEQLSSSCSRCDRRSRTLTRTNPDAGRLSSARRLRILKLRQLRATDTPARPPSASAALPRPSRWTRLPPPRCPLPGPPRPPSPRREPHLLVSPKSQDPARASVGHLPQESARPRGRHPYPAAGQPGSLTWSPPSTRSTSPGPSASPRHVLHYLADTLDPSRLANP